MLAERRGVYSPADAVLCLNGKRFGQACARNGFDGDDVGRTAVIEINGGRFAEHAVTFFVDAYNVFFVDRNVNAFGHALGRPAAKLFKLTTDR